MGKQLKLVCWSCSKTYNLINDTTTEMVIMVVCPYCSKEAAVDLVSYEKEEKTKFSSSGYITARLAGDSSTDAPPPDANKEKPKEKIDKLTDTLLNLLDRKKE